MNTLLKKSTYKCPIIAWIPKIIGVYMYMYSIRKYGKYCVFIPYRTNN